MTRQGNDVTNHVNQNALLTVVIANAIIELKVLVNISNREVMLYV